MNTPGEGSAAEIAVTAATEAAVTAADLDMVFLTKNVSDEEQAAVIAALGALREEETLQVKQVARRANEPWRRSQRSPEGIREFTE